MGFFKKSVANEFSQEERQEGEVSLFYALATFAVIVESVLAIAYCADFASGKNYSELGQLVAFIALATLSMGLISFQQYAYMKFARAVIYTNTWKDDFWWGLLAFAISVLFLIVDYNGGRHLLNNINGYEAKSKDYKGDNNYSELSTDRAKLEKEKADIETKFEKSIALCFECQAIEEEYKHKVVPKKRSSKPSEQAWINSVNSRAELANSRLEAEKNRKISLVSAKIEKERDAKLNIVQAKIDKIDESKKGLSAKIDASNDEEKRKEKEREDANGTISFFVTPLTQFLLFLMRWLIMKKMEKEEKEWVEKGLFLKIYKLFSYIAQFIDTKIFVIAKKSEANMANRKLVALDLVAAHRESFNDERIGLALKAKSVDELSKMIKSPTIYSVAEPTIESEDTGEDFTSESAKEEDKKKSEIIEEKEEKVAKNHGTLSDKELILNRIEAYKEMVEFLEGEDKIKIEQRIFDYSEMVDFL